MYGVLLALHIIVSILLIVAVLLQSGKGADMGAVFGGAGSQALFGSAGPADFLNKATRVLVVVFMLTSLTLGYSTFKRPSKSIMDNPAATAPAKGMPAPSMPSKAMPSIPAPMAPAPAAPASQAPAAPALPGK